jgi:hypothetical protein
MPSRYHVWRNLDHHHRGIPACPPPSPLSPPLSLPRRHVHRPKQPIARVKAAETESERPLPRPLVHIKTGSWLMASQPSCHWPSLFARWAFLHSILTRRVGSSARSSILSSSLSVVYVYTLFISGLQGTC